MGFSVTNAGVLSMKIDIAAGVPGGKIAGLSGRRQRPALRSIGSKGLDRWKE